MSRANEYRKILNSYLLANENETVNSIANKANVSKNVIYNLLKGSNNIVTSKWDKIEKVLK